MVLKVGVIEKDPFIINKDKLSGFTIDLWDNIAKKKKINFKYETIDKKKSIDKVIEEDTYDIILGVVDINPERIQNIDFTTPYYFTNYSLVSIKEDNYKNLVPEAIRFFGLLFTYIIISTFVYFITHSKNNTINNSLLITLKNMIPIPFLIGRTNDIYFKFNLLFGFLFLGLFSFKFYQLFINKKSNTELPKKPILVDSKNTVLIKYLKSRGAQVKIINNTGGLNKLLDIYIDDNINLAGVFVSEEGKINKDGTIFNNNPKYQKLKFNRYNFGKSQISILVKKNHPLYDKINGEIIKMKENGELFEISSKWLNYTHSKQIEI